MSPAAVQRVRELAAVGRYAEAVETVRAETGLDPYGAERLVADIRDGRFA
ncbi:hypothetical protein [Marinitenerispora sediminis]|nr:hypothetical protein [Marinitenerispora sediminis]